MRRGRGRDTLSLRGNRSSSGLGVSGGFFVMICFQVVFTGNT